MSARNKDVYIDLAEKMVDYYDKQIVNSKKKVDALNYYKTTGYTLINQILLKKCEYAFSLTNVVKQQPKRDTISVKELIRSTTDEFYLELQESMNSIKVLDKVIDNAPFIVNDEITVYRGMAVDIYDDLVCENKQYYYTFPTYISTSFSSNVSHAFRGEMVYFILWFFHVTPKEFICPGT
jgi:hypothetical protein